MCKKQKKQDSLHKSAKMLQTCKRAERQSLVARAVLKSGVRGEV